MPTLLSKQPSQQDLDLYVRAVEECNEGHPRLFMESYLWVDAAEGLIPMRFTPQQEALYEGSWGRLERYDEALRVCGPKARKATYTTMLEYASFAFLWCVAGFHVVCSADKQENSSLFLKMLDTCYDNLPEWMRQEDSRIEHWKELQREIKHPYPDGRMVTSSIRVGSPHTGGFGRGATPKMQVYDEAGLYDPEYEKKLYAGTMESAPRGAWIFLVGTAGENVQSTVFYSQVKAIEARELQGTVVWSYWYLNPQHSLPAGSDEALPQDVGAIVIGEPGHPGSDTEQSLGARFPRDGVLPEERIRWRRQKIYQATLRKGGNRRLGYMEFQKEFLEDRDLFWLGGNASQIEPDIQLWMREQAQGYPLLEERLLPSGFTRRIWRRPTVGVTYCLVLDIAGGHDGGDATAACMFDVGTGMMVAELYGHPRPQPAVLDCVELCRLYNEATYCPLVTGDVSAGVVTYAQLAGYARIYSPRVEMNATEKQWRERRWGFDERGASVQERLREAFLSEVDQQTLWTPSAEAQADWFRYDWGSKEHKPDRTICAAVFAAVRYELPQGRLRRVGPRQEMPASPYLTDLVPQEAMGAGSITGGTASRLWGRN